jgi:hypothetical protein
MSNSANARSPAASSSSSVVGCRCAARSTACSGETPSSRAMSATVACFTPSQMCAMVRADATRVSHCLCFRNPRIFCSEERNARDGAVSLFSAGTADVPRRRGSGRAQTVSRRRDLARAPEPGDVPRESWSAREIFGGARNERVEAGGHPRDFGSGFVPFAGGWGAGLGAQRRARRSASPPRASQRE